MKKKILMAISVLLVLGLGIAAFAFKTTNNSSHHAAMECCCKNGSCPMKDKSTATTGEQTTSCCDNPDCCCKGGDSCPMKNKSDAAQKTDVDMKNVSVVTSEESCDKPCCKHKKQS
jgi:hypothetical protein